LSAGSDSLVFEFEKEAARVAVRSIRERKLRSALTATGIVIGIAAIISLMSVGEGTQAYITEQFQQFGASRIMIMPRIGGGMGAVTAGASLTDKDVDTIRRVRGVELAIPIYYKTLQVGHKDETKQMQLYGVNSREAQDFFSAVQAFEISTGRFLRPGDRYAVVLGSLAATNSFEEELSVRDKLMIKDKSFEIVGIMKETGSNQDDMMAIVPLETLRDMTGEEESVSIVFAQAGNAAEVEAVADAIQQKLDEEYGERTFTVLSTTKLAGQITAITGTLSLALSGIAGIALVVAGIGIANTMYMSTLERTREIGIMKAVGATTRNVMEIFLAEAAIIGLIGGVVGLAVGTAMSYVIGIALASYGVAFKTLVTPQLAAMAVGFSVAVGVLSGFLPARNAARLDPIQALRYE